MTNASIIGFITQEKVAEFKKLLGDRFIAVADFPDGVPYACLLYTSDAADER